MEIIIITGISGAGKSQAAHTLEDMGCYCVDNMPAALLSHFAELCVQAQGIVGMAAFIIDVRGETAFSPLLEEMEKLRQKGNTVRLLFLECADSVVINRYKESRRTHPLAAKHRCTIQEALAMERQILAPLREHAYAVIDTTSLSLTQLRQKVEAAVSGMAHDKQIFITCTSFGFKRGIPPESDMIFDVRCFPNPFYIPELKAHTGRDAAVRDYVFSFDAARQFLQKLYEMLDFLLPLYVEEGRTQLNLAVGCTGGRHRSVAFIEALGAHIAAAGYQTVVVHRDMKIENA